MMVAAAIALALVLGLATQAQAANLEVHIGDGTTTLACQDNASCDTSNLTTGVIVFNATLGTATVSATASVLSGPNDMKLTYSISGGLSTKIYRIEASDNFLSGSSLVWTGTVSGTQSVSGGGGVDTTDFDFFANTNNVKFLGTTGLCEAGPFAVASFGPVPADCTSSASSPLTASPFALTSLVEIKDVTTATGNSEFRVASATAVPEPGTLLLLASGFAVAGMRRAFAKRER